jgi:hypothetical protein
LVEADQFAPNMMVPALLLLGQLGATDVATAPFILFRFSIRVILF